MTDNNNRRRYDPAFWHKTFRAVPAAGDYAAPDAYRNILQAGATTTNLPVNAGNIVGERILVENLSGGTITLDASDIAATSVSLADTQHILLEWDGTLWANIRSNGTVT